MTEERFLITGAMGCIGSWVVRELVREGISTAVFDLAGDPHRLRLILDEDELSGVHFITGDISDFAQVERAVQETRATRLIHLAALQVPFCKANPVLGAQVNVVGTVNIFEAARKAGVERVVYASSIAVYGQSEEYPEGRADDSAALNPRNLYGVFKQANEGTARIYWLDHQLSSIGLRPYVIYGAGRDQGITSGPTKAMLAAAFGQGYHIPFGGQCVYQYTRDAARMFIQAARAPFAGAEVFNVRGAVVQMGAMVAAIEQAEPAVRGKITFTDQPLALPADVDDSRLRAVLGALSETPLQQGVDETLQIFKKAISLGQMTQDKI